MGFVNVGSEDINMFLSTILKLVFSWDFFYIDTFHSSSRVSLCNVHQGRAMGLSAALISKNTYVWAIKVLASLICHLYIRAHRFLSGQLLS